MRCPYCRTDDTRVVDSREQSGGDTIRRRRECISCHQRFTTYERVEAVSLLVIKKDGRREEFNQDKLRLKLRVALTKRPVSEEQIDQVISRVEAELLAMNLREVPSEAVGEAVLRQLRDLDQVAYIRFASVYRQFADIEELRRAIETLA
jgi:transcriptional repressor NrdR